MRPGIDADLRAIDRDPGEIDLDVLGIDFDPGEIAVDARDTGVDGWRIDSASAGIDRHRIRFVVDASPIERDLDAIGVLRRPIDVALRAHGFLPW